MKRIRSKQSYSVADLVAAAYVAAGQATRDRLLTAILVSKILEDWLMNSNRPDLIRQLETASS
jgi:hypothetical protein